jgi:hypothetical protein
MFRLSEARGGYVRHRRGRWRVDSRGLSPGPGAPSSSPALGFFVAERCAFRACRTRSFALAL